MWLSPFESINRRLPWYLLFAWIALIFLFSTDTFSGERSSGVLSRILTFFFQDISAAQLASVNFAVRKSAHVSEYFVLGFLALGAFRTKVTADVRARLCSIALVLVIALSDEFHQSLTVSRTGTIVDVAYDCFGGFAAILILPRARHESRAIPAHPFL